MIAQRSGAIINISSGAGQSGTNGSYSVSKAALNMMNKALALELQEHNISVNALAPGATFVREPNPGRPNTEPRPNMLRPETSLPISLFLANQDPIEVTGEIIEVIAWNEAHGLGGREAWSVGAQANPKARRPSRARQRSRRASEAPVALRQHLGDHLARPMAVVKQSLDDHDKLAFRMPDIRGMEAEAHGFRSLQRLYPGIDQRGLNEALLDRWELVGISFVVAFRRWT